MAIEQQMWSDFLNGRDMRERDEKERDMRAQHGNWELSGIESFDGRKKKLRELKLEKYYWL